MKKLIRFRRTWLRFPIEKPSRAIALALALLLIALFMPTIEIERDAFEYIVVFDISQSMNVEDYEIDGSPVSRIAYAREATRQALRELPCGSRIGWGVFTGYRTLLLLAPVEVCAHYNDLLASLEQIDGRMRWSNASEITKGLYWSVLAAQETEAHPNVIFVSDGQEAPPLDPAYPPQMLDALAGTPIGGWLIGTGAPTPSPIPKIDEEGRRHGYWRAFEVVQSGSASEGGGSEHLSGLREAHLQALANRIGFDYARLTGPGSLRAAMQDERFARRRPTPVDLSWIPVSFALLLLALRFRPDR